MWCGGTPNPAWFWPASSMHCATSAKIVHIDLMCNRGNSPTPTSPPPPPLYPTHTHGTPHRGESAMGRLPHSRVKHVRISLNSSFDRHIFPSFATPIHGIARTHCCHRQLKRPLLHLFQFPPPPPPPLLPFIHFRFPRLRRRLEVTVPIGWKLNFNDW